MSDFSSSEIPNRSDTISRQAAIRWIKTECNPYGNPTLDFESGKKVIEHLEQMPTIDQVKRGKWVYKGKRGRFPICECSVCGNAENADWAILGDNVSYCPNCGARMDSDG